MTREEAIKYFRNAKGLSLTFDKAADIAIEALQAEAVQGEWIDTGNWMGIECSRCKCHSRYVTPFCPQCGARMKGGENK